MKDLQPYTKYFITLKGVTEVEEGPPSEVVQLVTEEAGKCGYSIYDFE